jgi:hypothetical protein
VNRRGRIENKKAMSKLRGFTVSGQAQMGPAYRLGGIRYRGGVNLIQALLGNVGTCRSDAKGEIQVVDPRE